MKRITTILWTALFLFTFWGTAEGQVRINELRSNASGTSSAEEEFVELIGIAGTDITDYQIVHYNGAASQDGGLWTYTIGSFTIPDDGIDDNNSNNLGFYVLGVNNFSTGTDESTSDNFQNGPDGIILYDDQGNIVDAIAWGGTGDIDIDDPGTVTTSGSPEADDYLHSIGNDQNDDNSLQAPDNVVGDNGSGWSYNTATIGSINNGQTSGSIILESSIKAEPANHVTSFTATGLINSVDLTWTDATGSPAPDAYLVKVSDVGFGSISDPSDTNPESDDTDLSDGSGALNVNSGVESASFSGLDELTTYYFKIYPYTNTGSDIDYKLNGTIPEAQATTLDTPDIVLNEFLADPPSGSDANKDGTASTTQDEFIEFVNTGNSNLDITGWTIEDAGGTVHTFPTTVLEPSQAVIIFSGGSATSDFGGAVAQISTGSFSLNNGGDTIILKNDSGSEIINYTYGSSEGSADQSYTRNPDLTGSFTAHSTADPGNSNFSPGTRLDGFAFIPWIEITGNEGWRMFSTPLSGRTYHDLLEPLWTQGNPGADYTGGVENVVTYDGSAFIAIGDQTTTTMTPGEGFLVFIYSDDDYTNSGANAGFPKVLEMSGTENSGPVSPSINENTEDTGTLVGNPYLEPIDWDDLTKNNIKGTVYVYDDSYGTPSGDDVEASGVAGSYRVWNGSGGSLSSGLIAPFQGFWVLYDGSGNASLTIEEADKTVGGTFYKEQANQPITINLKAQNDRMFNETFFSLNENGEIGMDNYDGLELTPLDHGDYISLASEVDGTLLDINNLPSDLSEPMVIPLHVNAYRAVEDGWNSMSGEVTLSWPELQNIPSNWTIKLIDQNNGNTVNLFEEDSYTFNLVGSASKIAGKKPFNPFSGNPIQREKSPGKHRFVLSIDPGMENNLPSSDIPDQFTLEQNYPNPFNPSTNIRYQIAEQSNVELGVYNVMGQRVATLVNVTQTPGSYEVTWDASEMASGIYYYRLNAGGVEFTRQMTLIK